METCNSHCWYVKLVVTCSHGFKKKGCIRSCKQKYMGDGNMFFYDTLTRCTWLFFLPHCLLSSPSQHDYLCICMFRNRWHPTPTRIWWRLEAASRTSCWLWERAAVPTQAKTNLQRNICLLWMLLRFVRDRLWFSLHTLAGFTKIWAA